MQGFALRKSTQINFSGTSEIAPMHQRRSPRTLGCLGVPKAGRTRLPLIAHLCKCMLLQRGRFLSSNLFLEGQFVVSWTHSYNMFSWESDGLPPEKFSWIKVSAMPENAPWQDRRDGKSSAWKAILAPPTPPNVGVPAKNSLYLPVMQVKTSRYFVA